MFYNLHFAMGSMVSVSALATTHSYHLSNVSVHLLEQRQKTKPKPSSFFILFLFSFYLASFQCIFEVEII